MIDHASPTDIVLTGVPRSGTTLTCYLLNKVENVVALHEPIGWQRIENVDPQQQAISQIDRYFRDARQSIRMTGTVTTKHLNGRLPDNPMGARPAAARLLPGFINALRPLRRFGLRSSRVERGSVSIDRSLTPDFFLCIKHTAPFTSLLPLLLQRRRCFAVIRNPLSVLLSWNSIDFPLRDGHLPEAEWLDPQLAARLRNEPDRFARQIAILDWFFEQFRQTLPPADIIRYEELIATNGRCLNRIVAAADTLDERLQSKNDNPQYNQRMRAQLARQLADSDGAFWAFYNREKVNMMERK